MRIIILLLLAMPSVVFAQINRSAKEFASGNIREYITEKLFKGREYKPVSYSEIKSQESKDKKVQWLLIHKFEITERELVDNKITSVQKLYQFGFYLGDKMNIVKADGYFIE
jgi:hypothetical protein